MAKIRDYAVTILATAATSAVCEMPTHATGDLLVAFVSKNGTATITTPANWSATAAVGASTTVYGGVYTRRAQSAAEAVTFTTGTSGAWAITIVSISGTFGTATNGSDALSVAATLGAVDSAQPYTGTSVTPGHTNCLVLSGIFSGATYGLQSDPGWVHVFTGDSGANSIAVAYTVEDQSGVAVATPNWRPGTGAQSDSRTAMIAIRDDGNLTGLDCYIDRATPPSYLLAGMFGSATGEVNSVAYIVANSTTLTSVLVNGTTSKTSTGLATTSTADAGYNPYRSVATTAGSSSTTNLGHSEITCSFNMTQGTGLFFGTFRPTIPRDYIDLGKPSQGGVYINFTNGTTTNARSWRVGGQFSVTTKPADYNPFVIQVQQTSNTAYAWSAAAVTWSTVSRVAFGSSSYYGAASVQWANFYMLNKAVLVGGTAANPYGIADVVRVINNGSGYIPLTSLSGATLTSYIPLQFGGVDRCNVLFDIATVQFPKKADNIDYMDFHVDDNVVGVEFYGLGATDSFKFRSTVFTSESPYYWRFNAASSGSATYDFAGSSVIGAGSITLVAAVPLADMTFNKCAAITHVANTKTRVLFKGSTSTTGAYVITGSTGTAISNALSTLTSCSFNDNITPAAAIYINYTGAAGAISVDMSNIKFSGNTKDIYWNATNAGSNVTFNLTTGANPTTFTAVNGAVNFSQSNTFTVTNIFPGSEVRVFDNSGASPVELCGVELIGTSTPVNCAVADDLENSGRKKLTYTHAFSSLSIFVVVLHDSYQYLRQEYTLVNATKELLVSQIIDRNYSDPNG